MPDYSDTVLMLSPKEMLKLEMIVVDKDKTEALDFLKELRRKIEDDRIKGMKNHI